MNGAAKKAGIQFPYYSHESDISSTCIAPYYIYVNNGSYKYTLRNTDSHYDFKDMGYGFTDKLVDCGSYYSSNVELIVYHEGSDPGLFDVMECYIPTTAYFSNDCLVEYDYNSDDSMPISQFVSDYEFYNLLSVKSVDENGYITACSLMSVE